LLPFRQLEIVVDNMLATPFNCSVVEEKMQQRKAFKRFKVDGSLYIH